MKANEAKLEVEKRRLRDALGSSESRSTKLELLRRSLEGELQRAKVVLSDREAELQLLQERVALMQRQVSSRAITGDCPGPSPPYPLDGQSTERSLWLPASLTLACSHHAR